MTDDIFQGYKGDALETLKKFNTRVWGQTVVETTRGTFTGTVLPRSENDDDKHIVVKIPMIKEGMKALKQLSKDGIRTNVTLIFNPNQALIAAKLGATYVSPFVGRLDDVIKSSGYRIGPFEVESSLMEHPAVVECAVTAAPDEIRGQVVKATIVLAPEYRPGSEALAKEIQEFVKNNTAPYKYPRIIEFVTELPKTISGKIRRVEIRERDDQG